MARSGVIVGDRPWRAVVQELCASTMLAGHALTVVSAGKRLDGWRRQRALASGKRAGAWSRRRALEMQRRHLKANWGPYVVLVVITIAAAPAAWLLPTAPRWFALGVWLTGMTAVLVHATIVWSGSAYLLMADQAEQWSKYQLDRLRRKGWKVIHRLLLRAGEDIDHVAIGPPGLVVVETKWSSNDWSSPRQQDVIVRAAAQAARNARTVALVLRRDLGSPPVHPVVVLWPSDERITPIKLDGATVLPGDRLADWTLSLDGSAVSDEAATRAWNSLEDHLARRDEADLRRYGPAPRTFAAWLVDLLQIPLGGLLGFLVGSWSVSWLGWPGFLVPAIGTMVIAAFGRRVAAIRGLASSCLVGAGIVVVVMLLAVAATVAARLV